MVLPAIVPSFKRCGSILFIYNKTSYQILPDFSAFFVMVLFPPVKLVDESVSGGGGEPGQAP